MRSGESRSRNDITYSHAKQPSDVVLQLKVLVGEGLGAVDTGATCTVTVKEISPLYHEVFNLEDGSVNATSPVGDRAMKGVE